MNVEELQWMQQKIKKKAETMPYEEAVEVVFAEYVAAAHIRRELAQKNLERFGVFLETFSKGN